MIEQLLERTERTLPAADRLVVEPFLHYGPDRIYNTLTDRMLSLGEPGFVELLGLRGGQLTAGALPAQLRAELFTGGWLVETAPDLPDLGSRFRLKYVSLEASTVCNQACYFCPVSVDRREDHIMPMEFYEQIVAQLAEHRDTLEGVSMIHYNEPTADKRFLDQVRMLKRYGLPPAVLTNATGLTPQRVDAILEMGGLRYLSINLSTLDRERYKKERGRRSSPDRPSPHGLPQGQAAGAADGHRGARVGRRGPPQGLRGDPRPVRRQPVPRPLLRGHGPRRRGAHRPPPPQSPRASVRLRADRVPSVQWVHVNPMGQCVLCCQDYHDRYVVGDLHEESLDAILSGPRMSLMRRWVYGMEPAPDDFICRQCIYALTA